MNRFAIVEVWKRENVSDGVRMSEIGKVI